MDANCSETGKHLFSVKFLLFPFYVTALSIFKERRDVDSSFRCEIGCICRCKLSGKAEFWKLLLQAVAFDSALLVVVVFYRIQSKGTLRRSSRKTDFSHCWWRTLWHRLLHFFDGWLSITDIDALFGFWCFTLSKTLLFTFWFDVLSFSGAPSSVLWLVGHKSN